MTIRQKEVVELLKKGLTNKQIADKLFVCEKTIKFHLTNIYKIVGVKSDREYLSRLIKGDSSDR